MITLSFIAILGALLLIPTVANAICDALDIDHIELPANPERVWRALNARRA